MAPQLVAGSHTQQVSVPDVRRLHPKLPAFAWRGRRASLVHVWAAKRDVVGMDAKSAVQERTLMQRLGQSFNSAGIALFARVALSDQPLALPHLSVADLRWIDWPALKAAGFRGCVFDKDNTLTEPYELELHPHVRDSLAECSRVFEGRLVLYSNSAGLQQFDPDGKEAAVLEAALGIPVLRHREKKPSGGSEDIEQHFECKAEQLIMVGDRYLTDVVFGNRNGMLTIRPAPFTSRGEPKAVLLARSIEEACAARWQRAGVQPPSHPLVQSAAAAAAFIRHPDAWQ
ncbi:putative phosphatidylglycerophosphatase [Chlorella vulgaris]